MAGDALTYGSAFSGIGGLDLAVEHVFGARPLWHVEPNPYASAVLRKHWPDVPNLHRIEAVDGSTARPDFICGGFPCQDISLAGRGEGLDGARSGLWWEFSRVIEELAPRIVILENVAALVARGLGGVLWALARLGFDAEWGTFRAADVGAPHLRRRLFIVAAQSGLSDADRKQLRQVGQRPGARGAQAHRGDGLAMVDTDGARRELDRQQAAPASGAGRQEGRIVAGSGEALADGDHDGRGGLGSSGLQHGERSALWHDAHRCGQAPRWPPGRGDADAWARWHGAVPGVRRGAYGPPRGVDARRRRERLRCLGNAVVPAQAAAAIGELWARLINSVAEE